MAQHFKFKSVITANWEKLPKIEGRVIERGKLDLDGKEREFLLVETATDQVRVFQSAGLDDLFKVAERGDRVLVEFLALVVTKKNRSMRQFRSSCWTDESDQPLPAVKPAAVVGRGRVSSK